MHMRRIVLAALACSAMALAADPFVGTWKLNPEKSKYEGIPKLQSAGIIIASQKDALKLTTEAVYRDRKAYRSRTRILMGRATLRGHNGSTLGASRVDARGNKGLRKAKFYSLPMTRNSL
jgi:hypothetical protein